MCPRPPRRGRCRARRHRQREHEPGAGLGVLDGDGTAVRLGDGLHDGQPQAEPLVARRHLAPAEALEDPVLVLVRYAGTGVPHPDAAPPSPSYDEPIAISSPVSGVLDGVVRQREHGLGDPLLVHRGDRLPGTVELPGPVAQPTRLREQRVGEPLQADRLRGQEVGAAGLREQDQVAHEPRHPVDLVEQQRPGLRDLRRVLVVEQLEVPAEHGERRLQLVAHVVEELALPDERLLEPREHAVEGPGQRGDVVVARLRAADGRGRSR